MSPNAWACHSAIGVGIHIVGKLPTNLSRADKPTMGKLPTNLSRVDKPTTLVLSLSFLINYMYAH